MRVQFDGEPLLRPGASENEWIIEAPFRAKVYREGHDPVWITVPHGFVTDLASVPRVPLAYMLFGGRARRSAILHDYLYVMQAGKAYADDVFMAAMKAEGVGFIARSIMFAAVHWFGAPIYDRKEPPRETVPADLGE